MYLMLPLFKVWVTYFQVQLHSLFFGVFFRYWPTPESCVEADPGDIAQVIQPMGLHHKRANTLIRFSDKSHCTVSTSDALFIRLVNHAEEKHCICVLNAGLLYITYGIENVV